MQQGLCDVHWIRMQCRTCFKDRRRFLPNLLNVSLLSDVLGRSVKLRISANALRTVEHRGGIDAFLLKADDAELSPNALLLKKEVRAALAQ